MRIAFFLCAAVALSAIASVTVSAQNTKPAPTVGKPGTAVKPPFGVRTFDDAMRISRERHGGKRQPPTGEVAVLNLTLESDGRSLQRARVNRVRIASANPPKVFARSGGTWEVRLLGELPAKYRIPNPLQDIEAENPEGSQTPFSRVVPSGSIPVDLIVPLSRNGKLLGVDRIQIVDLETGKMIVNTPVRQ
jgi:hypothetical protein